MTIVEGLCSSHSKVGGSYSPSRAPFLSAATVRSLHDKIPLLNTVFVSLEWN